MEMMAISAAIREKENWETKSKNPAILKRWQAECKATDEMFEYITAELDYYRSIAVGPVGVSAPLLFLFLFLFLFFILFKFFFSI
jgi:Protein of unknown function (DUF4246)